MSNRSWLGWLLCAGLSAQEPVFVELQAEPDVVVVGQTITVRVRIGIDATFRRESLVALFRQTLTWPVQVDAPWWDELHGARRTAEPEPVDGPSCVVNDRAVRGVSAASERRGERLFDVLELTRRLVVTGAGQLSLAGVQLRYAYATQFTDDFLQGRVPTDRREGTARSADVRVVATELPAGAPAGFSGAVGVYQLEATAAPLTVAVGQPLKLTLLIRGDGDLDTFRAPRLDGGDALRVLGTVEERPAGARKIVYELAARHAQVRALPPVALVHFVPSRDGGGFRTTRTEPIAITVLDGGGGAATSPSRPTEPVGTGLLTGEFGGRPPSQLTVWLALTLPFLWALLLWSWLRARALRAADPAGQRARRALAQAKAALLAPARDDAAVLTEYLAARLRTSATSVLSPTLPSRLAAAGIPATLAARASTALDELSAARYGGTAVGTSVAPLLDELEAAFRRAGER